MSTALFISPHLDDAVFSCATLIQRLVAKGTRVVVATVFTEGSLDYPQRRDEDRKALHSLGVEAIHLGHLDAPDRMPRYQTFREIIFGWHDADSHTLQAVTHSLTDCLNQIRPTYLYAPLGVGTHVDHRLTHDSARQLRGPQRLTFYEDRPYAYAVGATELRLRELGFDGGPICVQLLLKSFRQLPHVKQFLPTGPERKLCEKWLLQPLQKQSSVLATNQLIQATDHEAWVSQTSAFYYDTQFQAFCGTLKRLKQTDLRHSQLLGSKSRRTERYWQLPQI
ncbi:PIG-L deacetylase family protein [Prosthecobacter dejongeii]|uniref:LmbE family N-acetylglucosaminyl deacetylase n=1 Tax=Prosthecobacter dejongeii TaxID=48465 RepID=A0A7W7YIK3_9BACT|nr:PIG-L family deacetylase [Prosthecobacter dejongeii]MBB5036570.1 LmbE family N-acetylglucosaminyl deacetylase [Prosthecobacter dejongeii]